LIAPTLIIADPGLRSASGHHPAALHALLQGPQGPRGTLVYAHRDADPAIKPRQALPGLRLKRHFSLYLYEPGLLERPMSAALVDIRTLAEEYAQVVQAAQAAGARRGKAPASLIVHHTADWLQVAAIGYMLQRHPTQDARSPRHLIFLTFAPGVSHAGQVHSPRRLLNWRVALASLKGRQDVSLFTSCEELRHTYATFCGLGSRIAVHPVFHFDAPAWASAAQLRRRHKTRPLLLYVGDAKQAKGFLTLPRLAQALLSSTPLHLAVQFGLESGLRSAALDAAAQALEQLAAAHPRRLRLVRGYVDEAEMKTLMLGSSGIVFNYSAERYADQTSGVLWQAAAARLPGWFVGESWLTREARHLLPSLAVAADEAALVRSLQAFACAGAEQGARGALTAHAPTEGPETHARLRACEANTAYRQQLFRPMSEFLHEAWQPRPRMPDHAADSLQGQLVLFIDAQPPSPVRSAGHHAAWQEMLLLRGLGMRVCVGTTGAQALEPGIQEEMASKGLEWLGWHAAVNGFLQRHGRAIHTVYLNRFHVAEPLLPALRQAAPQARVLLNLADLHHLRIEREARLTGRTDLLLHAAAIQQRECAVMALVDAVLTYTEEEATLIHAQMKGQVRVERLPWVAEPRATPVPGHAARSGLLFVGHFAHAPNVDGLLWFAREVMPLLRQQVPGIHLRVCGGDAPAAVAALHGPDITIEGFVEDLGPVMDQCRLLVAPLRFGAGIKGKVAAALSAGLPVVASPVAAEGFVEAGEMGVAAIAQTPGQWCEVIAVVYADLTAWQQLSASAQGHAARRLGWEHGLATLRDAMH
jgi:glycosyltransferase involved in cell wall biosynthesis